jgi:hypothetical protein
MHYGKIASIGIVALALASGACNSNVADSRYTTAREESSRDTERAAELQQKRSDDISHLISESSTSRRNGHKLPAMQRAKRLALHPSRHNVTLS